MIELLLTAAIAAIALGLGVPSMLRWIARHAIAAQADAMRDALRGARSEAMKRGGPVVLCRTDAGDGGRCAPGGGDWQTWMVFADANRSGGYEPGEPMVNAHSETSGRFSVRAETASVRFEPTGIALPSGSAGPVVFLLSPTGSPDDRGSQRRVCVSARGDVVVVDGNAHCP